LLPTVVAIALVISGFALEFGGLPVAIVFGATYVVLGSAIAFRVRRIREAQGEVPPSAEQQTAAVESVRRFFVVSAVTPPLIAAALLIFVGVAAGTVLASAGLALMAAVSVADRRRLSSR
jgi:hypothetical protein